MDWKEYRDFVINYKDKLNKQDIDEINFFLKSIIEIETLKEKVLKDEEKKKYFREIMLPKDYVRILQDLRMYRIQSFYKISKENLKNLKKKELEKDKITEMNKNFEEKLIKKLHLKYYIDRQGNRVFK